MDWAYRLDRLTADGHRLIEVASRDLAAAVPACPGWCTKDLLGHIVPIWTAMAAHIDQRALEPMSWAELPDEQPAEALAHVLESLRTTDPATPVWTWSADQTVGFFLRRAHQETLMHRVDAEQALGDPTPVPGIDGVDGVDELFAVMLSGRKNDLPSGSLHLHQTDGDGEFMLQVVDGTLTVTHEHQKGDAALRATGEELLLSAWGRRGLAGLELFGDADVAAQWIALSP